MYLAGLQLLLSSGRQSLLVLGLSGLAGLLYRANFCHLQRLRVRAATAAARIATTVCGRSGWPHILRILH